MDLRQKIEYYYGETEVVIFADGWDSCIIGFDPNTWSVVYSRTRVIDLIIEENDATHDEAVEYAEYHVFGAMLSAKTPIWIEDFDWENINLYK